jgi:hypothetical protein
MIKLMMMRSALFYPELGSALDYRETLVSLCIVQVYRSKFNESLVALQILRTTHIFVQLGHGQNNVNKCVSVDRWA